MAKHNDFGKEGEEITVKYLLKHGYRIKCRNYRYLKAEIDIIAEQDGILAIIEVKTRKSDHVQSIAEAVTKQKIQHLVKAADHYVTSNKINLEIRFDIITVLKNNTQLQIEHIKDAFYHF